MNSALRGRSILPKSRPIRIVLWVVFALIASGFVLVAVVLIGIGVTNISGIGSRARVARTHASGQSTFSLITAYILDTGQRPASLNALVPTYTAGLPIDAWNRPFVYTLDNSGTVMLVSLGADGLPGGAGDDADLWWRILPGGTSDEGRGTAPAPNLTPPALPSAGPTDSGKDS